MTRKWDEHPNDGKGLLRVSKMLNDEQSKTEVVPSNQRTYMCIRVLENGEREVPVHFECVPEPYHADALAEIKRLQARVKFLQEWKDACEDTIQRERRERGAHETAARPIPHGVVYDKPGWLCSICGFWNNIRDNHCAGVHLESDGASEETAADPRCPGQFKDFYGYVRCGLEPGHSGKHGPAEKATVCQCPEGYCADEQGMGGAFAKKANCRNHLARVVQQAAAPLADRLAILGYAPGGYSIRCMDCKEFRDGCDKRALRCHRCALARDSENGKGEQT